jgi:hypothetical protein
MLHLCCWKQQKVLDICLCVHLNASCFHLCHTSCSAWIINHFRRNDTIDSDDEEKNLEKQRKFLMLLAVLAASATYQAGINPPGGFWADNNGGH